MEGQSATPQSPGRWWGPPSSTPSASTDVMNQLCRVCGEPAAGFHFGAFTCEGCKSFFGRTYNNLGSISECKNHGKCVITKKNRTSCKACRLRKCLVVGMSKSGSRYGRRSNWFKIHCLLQEQQQTQLPSMIPSKSKGWEGAPFPGKQHPGSMDVDNNNSIPKEVQERSISPMMLPPGYASAEAAAAIWAARSSFPLVPPHPSGMPFFPPSFLQSPPFHHPPPSNLSLFPFMPLRPPSPNSSPAMMSESSSSSSSSPPPSEKATKSPERISNSSSETYENVVSVLRALGPVQESPMDLSYRTVESGVKKERLCEFEIQDQNSNIVGLSDGSSVKEEFGEEVIKKTPLDLTCSKT